jgi:hypothetical protein
VTGVQTCALPICILAADGRPVAANVGGGHENPLTPEELEANARRIVACVNACAGISTENLEENLPVKELALRYNAALKQRDELLQSFNQAMAKVESATACHPNAIRYLLDEALEIWGSATYELQRGGAQ